MAEEQNAASEQQATEQQPAVASAESQSQGPAPKAKISRNRKITVVSIIAVVLIAAGAGFWVWHEQPSFCNAICHTPMDNYVEGYYSGDETLLSATHEQASVTCMQCHEPKIEEQVTEGIHWVAGSYAFDEESGQLLSRSEEFANKELCLNESCHNLTLDELAEKTNDMAWNPHNFSEHGETDCGSCHQVHAQSTIVCSECHKEATEDVPEGWTYIPYGEEK